MLCMPKFPPARYVSGFEDTAAAGKLLQHNAADRGNATPDAPAGSYFYPPTAEGIFIVELLGYYSQLFAGCCAFVAIAIWEM